MLLFDVTRDFNECVAGLLKMPEITSILPHYHISEEELTRMIADHPKRATFLSNVCHQVGMYEKRYRVGGTKRERDMVIATSAQMFVKAILESRRQQNLSDAEKSRIINKDNFKNEVAQLIREAPSGETEKGNR